MRFSRLTPLALAPTCFGQLNVLAQAKGKYFGSATDNPELSDSAYVSILKSNQFGALTPGNTQKWQFIEPSENSFSFTEGDAIVNLAQSTGKITRCHTLVWWEELPGWVTSGSWTNDTLIAALKNHITQVVKHYKGLCYCWDVVNEAFNDDGTFRQDVFSNTIGPQYIDIALQAAAEADPTVKLYINDYGIETPGAKATAVQNLVMSLKERGIKIDGVGLQAHFVVGQTANREELAANLKSFINLGVEVAYTELDIRVSQLPASTSDLEQQNIDYKNTVGACVDAGRKCVGVTIWDYTDEYSWVPQTFTGAGAACPWDNHLNEKPAYFGIVEALGGNVASSSGAAAPAATTSTAITSTTTKSTAITSTTTTSTATRPAVTAPTTISPTFTTSTTKSPADTTSATQNPSANSSTPSPCASAAPHWGQCGGLTWEGPKTCEPPFKCTPINPWYSQCL